MVDISFMTPVSIGIFGGLDGVENLWFKTFTSSFCFFVFFYQSWLYLVNLFFMTPDSTGIFAVVWVALRISVLGAFHLPVLSELVVTG